MGNSTRANTNVISIEDAALLHDRSLASNMRAASTSENRRGIGGTPLNFASNNFARDK